MARQTSGDIFERLMTDHKEIRGLFERLNKSDGGGDKVFMQLKQKLQAHTKAEEKVFYAPLKSPQETHEMILEGIEEHHLGDLLLKELASNKSGTEQWHAKAKVLQETVEHHLQEEEKDIFKQAKKVLGSEKPQQLAQAFEMEKKRLLH